MTTKERGVIFHGHEVRATLDGRQSQFRRVVKPQPEFMHESSRVELWFGDNRPVYADTFARLYCPFGKVGDVLYLKTDYTTRYDPDYKQTYWSIDGGWTTTHGRAGCPERDGKHSGRFMPYWLSAELRLPQIEITDIRVQRVQEIIPADVISEGCPYRYSGTDPESAPDWNGWYRDLWNSTNKPMHGWDANPFVWCVSFKTVGEK